MTMPLANLDFSPKRNKSKPSGSTATVVRRSLSVLMLFFVYILSDSVSAVSFWGRR